jgi:hypothetical protein
MIVLKFICFFIVCYDVMDYIIKTSKCDGCASCLGMLVGIAARLYVLYGAAAYWLFA